MDFNKFIVTKTANGAVDIPNLQEDVVLKPTNLVKGTRFNPEFGSRVYQGCEKCKIETGHFLVGNKISCTICGFSYEVK